VQHQKVIVAMQSVLSGADKNDCIAYTNKKKLRISRRAVDIHRKQKL
jgi:hypothetical protein